MKFVPLNTISKITCLGKLAKKFEMHESMFRDNLFPKSALIDVIYYSYELNHTGTIIVKFVPLNAISKNTYLGKLAKIQCMNLCLEITFT